MPVALIATGSWAVTLGGIEGEALIGRPLDVTVPIVLDAGSDPQTVCARADVVQNDAPIDNVTTRIETVGNRQVLRVRTSRLMEEPVITVVVQVGCFLKTTRRFVLFSELPANAAEPAQRAQLPFVIAPSTGQAPVTSQAGAPNAAGTASSAGRRSRRVQSVEAQVGPPTARAAQPAVRSPRTTAPTGQSTAAVAPSAVPAAKLSRQLALARPAKSVVRIEPRNRLKLDPLDLTVDADPKLRMSMSIDTVPQVTPQQRAEALAVWKALNRTPTDVMQDYERMQAMSSDLSAMRQHIVSNKTELDAMRLQVQKAEQDRDRIMWALSAVIAVLLLVLVLAFFWRRRERAADQQADPNWWRDSRVGDLARSDGPLLDKTQELPAVAGESHGLDLDLSAFGNEPAPPLEKDSGPISAFSHLDFQGSQPANWRSLTTEELHDIQEQADFFVSLGDYDRAVNVLMSHVHASPQTSALAWMALLDLHHRLQRRQGYEGLRDQIERRMNVKVPEFDRYQEPTAGLEAYGDAMERIMALWPSPRVLDLIEDSVYRLPGGAHGEPFEMAAFHDLLMLYSLGKAVVAEPETPDIDLGAVPPSAEMDFPMTSIVPLSAELAGPSDEDMMVLSELLAGTRVDIDLDTAPDAPQPDKKKEDATVPSNLIDFEGFDAATSRLTKG